MLHVIGFSQLIELVFLVRIAVCDLFLNKDLL